MNALRAHPLPSFVLGVYITLAAASYVLMAIAWSTPDYERTGTETYWYSTWPTLFLAYPVVGALIAARHRHNAVGWLFCAVGLLAALIFFATSYGGYGLKAYPGSLPGAATINWFQSWVFFPCLGLILIYVPLLFPDGRPLNPRWRIVAWTGAGGVALAAAVFAFEPGPLSDGIGGFPNPYGILSDPLVIGFSLVGFPLTLGSAVAASTSMVLRLRRSRGAEREQLKWIAFAAAIVAVAFLGHLALNFSELRDRVEWYGVLWGAALCGVPVAAGIAILRRGLFDIDLVINRTMVYATMTTIVAGSYVLVVLGAGAFLRFEGELFLSLLATGLVAVAFQPLRDRVQRGVNRLLYGDRDDPYAVLSRLGQRLEGTLAPEEILPAIVRTMSEALRLPYAAIFLQGGTASEPAAAAGTPVDGTMRLPLIYQAEPVGELVVAPRSPGEPFGLADRRLLGDLTRQIGVAAHAVRLTADLQQSRERIVTSREEERRRLRRDLHDGLGAQLAALIMQAGAARTLLRSDPDAADRELVDLREELRAAVAEVRRLVLGLRPPALDELGLTGALRTRLARLDQGGIDAAPPALRVRFEADEHLPPLSAATEVAAFRIVEEAVTNVVRHARASSVTVALRRHDDAVLITIADDGIGIAPSADASGLGLHSMRERATELGGSCVVAADADGRGTLVHVVLPAAPGDGKEGSWTACAS